MIFLPSTALYRLCLKSMGKISAQPHPTLCIQFLNRENNDKNNTFPLGKQICFTIVWGCAETLLKYVDRSLSFLSPMSIAAVTKAKKCLKVLLQVKVGIKFFQNHAMQYRHS